MFQLSLIITICLTLLSCGNKSLDHYKAGLKLYSEGKNIEAIAAYNNSLKENPRFSDAYNAIGVSYAKLGEELFIEKESDNKNMARLNKIKQKFDYYENAIVNFRKSTAIQGKSITHYNIGKTYLIIRDLVMRDYSVEIITNKDLLNYDHNRELYEKKANDAFKDSISTESNSEYAKESLEEILNIIKNRMEDIVLWSRLSSDFREGQGKAINKIMRDNIEDLEFIIKYYDRDDLKVKLCDLYIISGNSIGAKKTLTNMKESAEKLRLEIAVNKMP